MSKQRVLVCGERNVGVAITGVTDSVKRRPATILPVRP